MDISVKTTEYGVEDRSWLGSAHATTATRTITLDVSAFTAGTHYPDGYIPSGTVVGRIAATGLYGPYAGRVNEEQTVTITGVPTGGNFTLSFNGETTAAIDHDATAAEVQTALLALANINVGDVTVTGGPLPADPVVVEFTGQYAGADVPLLVADDSGLTGGTTPEVAVTVDTAGGSAVATGLQTAGGHLFSSIVIPTSGADVGAALLEHGFVVEANLPTNSGLDDGAKADLAGITYR